MFTAHTFIISNETDSKSGTYWFCFPRICFTTCVNKLVEKSNFLMPKGWAFLWKYFLLFIVNLLNCYSKCGASITNIHLLKVFFFLNQKFLSIFLFLGWGLEGILWWSRTRNSIRVCYSLWYWVYIPGNDVSIP